MATERAANGEIPVEALLAQLRRAAEQDGVEDVDAVVAEFATFVRAQAPRIAAQRAGRRNGLSWSSALLTAGALSVAAFGAVASGLVTNPFLPSTPSFAGASDRDASDRNGDVLASPPAGGATADDQDPRATGTADGAAATDGVVEPAPATEFVETAPMTFTDPDALAVLAEQRSAGPTPPPSTTPAAPAPSPDSPAAPGATADPVDAATTSTTGPTTAPADATGSAPDATTTTVLAPVLDASIGPETLVATAPENQQNPQNTDQGGAG